MAGAISVAAVLAARYLELTCSRCGHVQRVARTSIAAPVCQRCRRPLPDPATRRR